MPKVACICGFVHELGSIPDAGWVVIRDRDYEKVVAAEIALARRQGLLHPDDDQHMATIANHTVRLYECPDCGTLAWLSGGDIPTRFFSRQVSDT